MQQEYRHVISRHQRVTQNTAIMFLETNFITIFGPALLVAILFIIGYSLWTGAKESAFEKALSQLKVNIVSIGFLMLILLFMLPSWPSLSTFGFPETVNEIQSNEQLLEYLQGQNLAIVRTVQVVHWFIFLFVWGLLSALYSVTKVFSSKRAEEQVKGFREELSAS